MSNSLIEKAPATWTRTTLGEIGRWSGGQTPSKSNSGYWSNGTIPWVSPKDVKALWVGDAADHLTEEALEQTGARLLPSGSLIFVTRSGILARWLPIAVTTAPVAINQDIKALTLLPDVHPDFVLLQLSSVQGEILRRTVKQGTTVQSVSLGALKQVEIALPSLAEQKRIAARLVAFLSYTASARTRLQSLAPWAEEFRRSIAVEAFTAVNSAPSTREVSLGEIAEISTGLALGKRYRTGDLVERPYLRVANVQRGRLDLDDIRTVLVSEVEAERYRLLAGDILMNEGGDRDKLGRGWVWAGEVADCIHQNHVFRVRLHDKDFPPEYISHYANEIGRAHFLSNATQTTNLASISKARLASLPIPLPTADHARRVLSALASRSRIVENVAQDVSAALSALDALDRAACHSAFSGRLVPADVNGAPVSLIMESLEALSPLKGRGKSPRLGRKTTMRKLTEAIAQWPAEGLTFENLRQQFPSDYETLKEAVFEMLGGAEPQLEQRYDDQFQIMRFFRRPA